MPLIIEDGSLVENANSYVTLAEVRDYADSRASTFPADDDAAEAAIIRAADYLETFRGQYKGELVAPAFQSLQWPRTGVIYEGYELPDDVIPPPLKKAQCELAIETANGLDLMPTGDGREVIRKKVDVLETEWAPGSGSAPPLVLPKVTGLLAPLLDGGGGSGFFTVDRA